MATDSFSLEGRGLKLDTADDINSHIESLRSSKGTITQATFAGNTLGVGACEALASALSEQTSLETLNLADVFTSRLLSEIPPALDALLQACLKLPRLHTINLSDNAFGLNTVEPLVNFLSAHAPLRHLILTNNGMGPTAGARIADALSSLADKKAAEEKPELETVICGRNRLESGSMEAWARCFNKNHSVKTVKMVQNGIRKEGIVTLLTHGLRHCDELRTLDLQDNTFTFSGSQALASVVSAWPELRELGVGDCLLSARGGVVLAQALGKGKNTRLEILRMQYDEIDAKGVEALVKATKEEALPRLRRVELNGNKFSEDDNAVAELREILTERKGDYGDDECGLDELSDLEEESEEEAEEQEDEDEEEEEQERIEHEAEKELHQADEAEDEPVAQQRDKSVDELADMLGKTEISK